MVNKIEGSHRQYGPVSYMHSQQSRLSWDETHQNHISVLNIITFKSTRWLRSTLPILDPLSSNACNHKSPPRGPGTRGRMTALLTSLWKSSFLLNSEACATERTFASVRQDYLLSITPTEMFASAGFVEQAYLISPQFCIFLQIHWM